MSDEFINKVREGWRFVSTTYVLNKTAVYPEHSDIQEFNDHRNKLILEYGSGVGSDAYEYLRRGNSVVLCDVVPENLAKAKENLDYFGLSENAIFHLMEQSYPLPFKDEMFDLVNSHGVVHHIPNGQEVVREFYRVLKSGGLCYIMLYSEVLGLHFEPQIKPLMDQNPTIKSQEEAFCWLVDGFGTTYAIPYTEKAGRKLLTDVGFEVLKTSTYNNDFFRTYKAIKR